MTKLPAQKINGLIDGIAVLQELAVCCEPESGKIIAEKLGLSPVRVNRILKTLAYLGLAYRSASRKYSVGPGMHVLAAQSMVASGLLSRALPYLEQLCHSHLVVALGVLWKEHVCYLFHHKGEGEFIKGFGKISLFPAVNSSIGLVLLAELPAKMVKQLFGDKYDENLFKKLNQIRKQGYASVRHADHVSLAVTIGNPAYAAIAVSNIKSAQEEKHFIALLRKYATEIS